MRAENAKVKKKPSIVLRKVLNPAVPVCCLSALNLPFLQYVLPSCYALRALELSSATMSPLVSGTVLGFVSRGLKGAAGPEMSLNVHKTLPTEALSVPPPLSFPVNMYCVPDTYLAVYWVWVCSFE